MTVEVMKETRRMKVKCGGKLIQFVSLYISLTAIILPVTCHPECNEGFLANAIKTNAISNIFTLVVVYKLCTDPSFLGMTNNQTDS
jgi:hypothetical protein